MHRTCAQTLNCEENNLKQLPPEIGQLRELRHLEAFKNQLTTLPKEIGGLVSLEYLNVFNCAIRKRAPAMLCTEPLVARPLTRCARRPQYPRSYPCCAR